MRDQANLKAWKRADYIKHREKYKAKTRAVYRTPAGRAARLKAAREYLRRRRGWTPERVAEYRVLQGDACAVCRAPFTVEPRGDHDHKTGQPRGLLCHKCNVGIGMLGDDLNGVERAAAYLREFSD